MPVTQVGIVYSASQEVVRRIVKLHVGIVDGVANRPLPPSQVERIDEGQEFQAHADVLHPNERMAFLPTAVYDSLTSHQQIHDHLGLRGTPCVTDRCMVVNGPGRVIAVGCFDPFIDTHPLGRIIPHATAQAGGTFIKGIYNPPQRLRIYADPLLLAA